MDAIYKNIEEYNPNKKRKKLVAFDDMIADMHSNKKLNPVATELYKVKHLSCFYHKIVNCCIKKY